MDIMELIELHTTYAPVAPSLVPADVDQAPVWKQARQERFNAAVYGEVAR